MPNSQDITVPLYPDVQLTEGHLKSIAKTRWDIAQMCHFDRKKSKAQEIFMTHSYH